MCTSLLSRFKYVIGIGVGAGAYVLAKFAVSLGLGWAGPELPLPAVSLGQGDEQELTPSGRLLGVRRARQQCPWPWWPCSLATGLPLLPGQGHISPVQCLCSGQWCWWGPALGAPPCPAEHHPSCLLQLIFPDLVEGLVLMNIDPNGKGWIDWAAAKVGKAPTPLPGAGRSLGRSQPRPCCNSLCSLHSSLASPARCRTLSCPTCSAR